jgi:hypothetical protein
MSRASATRRKQGDTEAHEARAIAAFLRGLAERVEQDATFAAEIATLLRESGLALDTTSATTRPAPRSSQSAPKPAEERPEVPNPFAVLREQGEDGLRATLAPLELPALRQIVRTHRLDPARISARWTARDRVIALIVDQVRARANLGRAFERV